MRKFKYLIGILMLVGFSYQSAHAIPMIYTIEAQVVAGEAGHPVQIGDVVTYEWLIDFDQNPPGEPDSGFFDYFYAEWISADYGDGTQYINEVGRGYNDYTEILDPNPADIGPYCFTWGCGVLEAPGIRIGSHDLVTDWYSPGVGLNVGFVCVEDSNLAQDYGICNAQVFNISVTEATVPAPASLALLGIGLAGLGLRRRRK